MKGGKRVKAFSKEKYKESMNETDEECSKWVDELDGKTKEEIREKGYGVSNDWLADEENYRKGKDNMKYKVGEKVRIKLLELSISCPCFKSFSSTL